MIHIMIYIISVMSYIYLNNIIISPIKMCHLLIKVICCNRSLKDSDMVYEPDNLTVPFEDVKKVGSAIEHVVEDVLAPQTTTVKDIASLFDGKKNS